MHQFGNNFLAHERLAIIDPTSGDQPLFNEDKTIVVTVNGEIYNHKELKAHILEKCPGKKFNTQSDCEVGAVPLHDDMVHATGGMHQPTGCGKHVRLPFQLVVAAHWVTCFSSSVLAATMLRIHWKQQKPCPLGDT